MNYYEILGVKPTATAEEIRAAYIALCKDLHPDKLAGLNENLRKLAEERLKLINQAYEILKDEQARAAYDRELAHQSATTDSTLDELLSSAVLDTGFQTFVQEEEKLWQDFTRELQRLRERYNIAESPHPDEHLFPDDLTAKVSRMLSLIFSGILGTGIAIIIFAIIAGIIAFVIAFVINLFLPPLGLLVMWLYFYIGLPFLALAYVGLVLSAIFSKDEVTDEDCRQREKTECIFSRRTHRYWQQTEELGAHFRAYKIFSRLYPSRYVKAVAQRREEFSKNLKELLNRRKDRVRFFKELHPRALTKEFVAGLSACERLLLMKALQQKADELQQQQQNEAWANFFRVAGTVVLLGIILGGGGRF
ncbi:MAG: DnaJ domain-containing protein [Gloeomargarita sp. SKYB31]|nr:DnaJ domain-containing protein [Gloeomargarita sp. SKYB31]